MSEELHLSSSLKQLSYAYSICQQKLNGREAFFYSWIALPIAIVLYGLFHDLINGDLTLSFIIHVTN